MYIKDVVPGSTYRRLISNVGGRERWQVFTVAGVSVRSSTTTVTTAGDFPTMFTVANLYTVYPA